MDHAANHVTGRTVHDLVQTTRWFVSRRDDRALRRYCAAHWPSADLVILLRHRRREVIEAAVIALGLVGAMDASEPLSRILHHDDHDLVSLGDLALRNIWFRSTAPDAVDELRRAITHLRRAQPAEAEAALDRALAIDPLFAEACHQRAIVHCLQNRPERAVLDAYRALALNPCHFAAAAIVGHALLRLGRLDEAVAAYQQALAIHPRLEGVRQALRRARAGRQPPRLHDTLADLPGASAALEAVAAGGVLEITHC